jgi:hypothetical protein
MDRLDIISTYLTLFLPLKGQVFNELSDRQKAKILEANTEPIKMSPRQVIPIHTQYKEISN